MMDAFNFFRSTIFVKNFVANFNGMRVSENAYRYVNSHVKRISVQVSAEEENIKNKKREKGQTVRRMYFWPEM